LGDLSRRPRRPLAGRRGATLLAQPPEMVLQTQVRGDDALARVGKHPTGLIRETRPGGNAASPTERPGLDPGASLVTETNLSPVFFAQIQTHVDLDASPLQVSGLSSVSRSPTATFAA
jgi:hypothetical protein